MRSPQQNSFSLKVLGEGTVSIQPNRAIISLGVVTEDQNLQQAQQTNAQTSSNVISAVRQYVSNDQIQTRTYRIDIQYDYKDGEQIFRGYRVTNIIDVTIDQIDQVAPLIDSAVSSGANTVKNIQMTVSNPSTYKQQALQKAIQNAQEKAKLVGETLNISIQTIPYQIKERIQPEDDRPRNLVLGISTESPTTPIEPGLLEVTSVVEAKFTTS
ncbi:DUF541 domain-containing protein [Salinibacillus xinjiangensis]|uniref:DUF541 domain-containing protein n=2 Tax=Salinibacillus xinjiangensis TaxID=1229268 RepID=A0A6G1X408_9BACI|nr:DUF541 domain-containing protein [Salinibacillus xinjiangensis]